MPLEEPSRVRVGALGDFPRGEGRVIDAGGVTLAIFNVDGRYFALDNRCPHRGGPLGEGDVDGTTVTCPWHSWRWDVTTGANVNNPGLKVGCFAVVVEDGALFVQLG